MFNGITNEGENLLSLSKKYGSQVVKIERGILKVSIQLVQRLIKLLVNENIY